MLDGLNLAYWAGLPPSLRVPLGLLAALLERGDRPVAVFDASARHQLPPDEQRCYAALLQSPLAIQVPSGESADGHLLKLAVDAGACVISRDRFREFRRKYRAVTRNPDRRLDGIVRDDQIVVPGADLVAGLPASAELPLLAGFGQQFVTTEQAHEHIGQHSSRRDSA